MELTYLAVLVILFIIISLLIFCVICFPNLLNKIIFNKNLNLTTRFNDLSAIVNFLFFYVKNNCECMYLYMYNEHLIVSLLYL